FAFRREFSPWHLFLPLCLPNTRSDLASNTGTGGSPRVPEVPDRRLVACQYRNRTAPLVIGWSLLPSMPISGGKYEGSKVLCRASSGLQASVSNRARPVDCFSAE